MVRKPYRALCRTLMNDTAARLRRQIIGRKYSDNSWSVVLFIIKHISNLLLELLQKISSDINRSKRKIFLSGAMAN